MIAEQQISYFDDEYLQGALGVPEKEITRSLEQLERTTHENGGPNRRRAVFHLPEMLLVTCGETANGVFVGRFTTLEISASGNIVLYRGVSTQEATLSREYLSTLYFFENELNGGISMTAKRGQHVVNQSWIDMMKWMQTKRTPQPSKIKKIIGAKRWSLESRLGLELILED